MKFPYQLLITLSLLLFGASAIADENIPDARIYVNCQCDFYVDGLPKTILTSGESNVTQQDLENCRLEDGKVVNPENGTACFKAKMNASWNCMQSAKSMINPNMMKFPSVLLNQDTCYGQIEMAGKIIHNN